MTGDPATLVAMLYDTAVLSLKAAVQVIHNDEIEALWKTTIGRRRSSTTCS